MADICTPEMLKHCYIVVVVCAALFHPELSSAQNKQIDSLLSLLAHANDTGRVNILNKLSSSYWYLDPQKTIHYAEEALTLASSLSFKKGMITAYNNTGVGHYQVNRYDEALRWYNKALALNRETGNFLGEGHVLSNIGMIYWKQGVLTMAVEYYLQALKIWEDHELENEMASVFDNLGNVYNEQEEYDRALSYYQKAVAIQKKFSGNEHERSMTLSNIGTAHLGKTTYHEALKYFLQSLDLLPEEDNESRAVSLSNIGLTYIELGDADKAASYLSQALVLQEQIQDSDAMIHTLLGLSKTNRLRGDLKQSEIHARRALDLALQIKSLPVLAEAWLALSEISEKKGDFKNAHDYYRNYVRSKDSITDTENIYKIAQLQAGFETKRKQEEIEALKRQREEHAFRRNAIIAGLMALLIISGLVVSRQRLKIRKNNQLGKINEQLVSQSSQLQEQADKLRELDKMKSTFFANISHEFRTPLTLILNSLSDRISSSRYSTNHPELEQLQVMYRNARRLLNLINQLLDLSKVEAGQMKLAPENCDLSEIVRVVHGSFSSLGVSKNITFTYEVPSPVICRLDMDKVEKILYNLLSNAFKFTPIGGSIQLQAHQMDDAIQLTVRDSGRGIPQDQLPHVFNRFYTGKQYYSDEQGTGIGLALTKELVELHGGKIWVESDQHGTCFFLRLPFVPALREAITFSIADNVLGDVPLVATSVPTERIPPRIVPQEDPTRATVLIIEDNEDLRNYIQRHLDDTYEVLVAGNGHIGLEKAVETVLDLVITDWMMPELDGLEVCRQLKSDERTSHIPVIMLTALAGKDSRFQGLETGADDYLTKPFDNKELNLRIKNLVDGRKVLRERFSRELYVGPKKIKVSSMDEKFLEKVTTAVETYMGEPDFNMEKFGQEVGLSRMQLHRKLKALTGESPGDFLRTTRLKKARLLLEARAGNVSEIAYEVGFNNLSYFSKCYREYFGVAPNETISSNVTNVIGNVTR